MSRSIIYVAILLMVAMVGLGLQATFTASTAEKRPLKKRHVELEVVGHFRPEFSLRDQHGSLRNVNEWDGKVLMVNFWATWCSPCKKEIPGFIALQAKYGKQGLQVIGVALDVESAVKTYSHDLDINYPVMAAEIAAAEISRRYGNRSTALPFTAFVGRDGKIVLTKAGELSQHEAEKILQPLL